MNELQHAVKFDELKKAVPLSVVLNFYNHLDELEEHGEELVGVCPFCEHSAKKKPFHANLDKNVWQCFACKRKGSIIDYVKFKKKITLREAGNFINKTMTGEEHKEKRTNKEPVSENKVIDRKNEALVQEEEPKRNNLPAILPLDGANRLVLNGFCTADEFIVIHIKKAHEMAHKVDWGFIKALKEGR